MNFNRRMLHCWLYTAIFIFCFYLGGCSAAEELSFNGNGYMRYDIRSKPFNPNVNRINLEFKTAHPSGVLIHLIGFDGDTLQLDLVQGSLRLKLKKSGKTVNEVLVGRKLDDNKWHTVHILRISRLLDITLDAKKDRVIMIPGFTTDLNLNRVLYIGGMNKEGRILMRDNSKKDGNKNFKVTNFQGCMQNVVVDNKKPFEELRSRNKKVVLFGTVSRPCQSRHFSPIQFNNPQSVVDVVRIPVSSLSREMNVKLQFRTFHTDGTIVFAEGKRCHFVLGVQKKQVYLELKQNEILPAKVEIQGEINDGLWHWAEITVTQTMMFLQVDNSARISASLPKTSRVYHCSLPSRLLIGGDAKRKMKSGFVGCLNRITVNGRNINPFDTREVSLHGAITRGCKIKDKCFPSPCRNDGRCYQTWYRYDCDCSKTTFYGKYCNIPIYKATCAGYKTMGLKGNSYCIVDPDGTGRLSPYTISCNLDKQKNIATTVHHNRENKVNFTDGTDMVLGSHFHLVNYEIGMEHVEALIKSSVTCRQHLKFDCYNAALLNSPKGRPNAMWYTRTGEAKSYWGGVPDGGRGCKCGLSRSCLNKDKLCNCDSINNKWVSDSGYVEDKALLPITKLYFTGIHRGLAYITLGPLECFGTKEAENTEERLPNNILSQVCMLKVTKEYMTANETQLVWDTPGERFQEGEFEVKTDITGSIITTEKSTTRYDRQTPVPIVDEGRSAHILTSAHKDQFMNSSSVTAMKRNGRQHFPFKYPDVDVDDRGLSVLEIILIAFAGLAVSVLLVKFVVLKGIDFIRGRYQIKRLYLNEQKLQPNGTEQLTKLTDQTEFKVKKGVLRNSRNSDWV